MSNAENVGQTHIIEDGRLLAGRYRLLQKIGEGGAAEVFRARDERLHRIVAVKLLRAQYLSDEQFQLRFAAEARAAASLSHPNIVEVYDFGEAENGETFIAMQYVDGRNLKEVLQERGRLTPAEAVAVTKQLCLALRAAHNQGLIHRDVKPQNIMVDRGKRVRLADFGIAKALAAPAFTQAGVTFGTASYLSPEQASGRPVSPASDIYALGCVMYEMLSGAPPFVGDNPATVAYKQVWEQPRPLHDLAPEVPPSLEAVVMRCLNKEPQQRYPSAEKLAADLDALSRLFSQPTQAITLGAVPAIAAQHGSTLAASEQSRLVTMPPAPGQVPPVRSQRTVPVVNTASAVPQHRPGAASPPPAPHNSRAVIVSPRQDGNRFLLPFLVVAGLGLCGLLGWAGSSFLGQGSTGGSLPLPSPTRTVAAVVTAPPLPSPTGTATPVVSPSPDETGTALAVTTDTPVPTVEATSTETPLPSPPSPPTVTAEPPPVPTETPAPPIPADTPEPLPTDTPQSAPTDTPVPPEPTSTPVTEPLPTDTPPPEEGSTLEAIVDEVIAGNPKAVGDYLDGKVSALRELVGDLRKIIDQRKPDIDLQSAIEMLTRKLEELRDPG